MNISEQTLTQLKLKDNNQQWLWGVLFGIPFVVIGFGIAITTGKVTVLECRREPSRNITCQRTVMGLIRTETTLINEEVIKAGVITAHGTGVVLSTSEGSVDFSNHRFLVGEEQYQIANKINAFINSPQEPDLKAQQDDRWEGLISGAMLFLPGIAIIWASLTIPMQVWCVFDKISEKITLEKQYPLFLRRSKTSYKLNDIQQAQTAQLNSSSRNPIYSVQLQLISAKSIALSPPSRDRRQCEIIANTINQFLK